MRIAIDLRPLMSGKLSGVEVYILSMLHTLFSIDQKNEYILWYNSYSDVDISHFPSEYPNVSVKRTRIPNKFLNLSLSLLRWPKIDRLIGKGIDLIWVPDPRPTPVSKKCKKIVTFHDLSFEDFNQSFNLKTRLWHKVLRPKKEAREADAIVAVSHFTKNRLREVYKVTTDKIHVIHEASSVSRAFHSFDSIQEIYHLPDRYFLCLSTLESRKNIAGVVKAYLNWQEEARSDIHLVIAGKRHPSIFSDLDLPDDHPFIKMIGFVEEDDKASLYQNAFAFLFPSFYEGFGLPILEAMQCGIPVITSTTSAMPEVAGDAALLVDPQFNNEIKMALHKIYQDSFYREQLIKRGFENVKRFSWDEAVKGLTKLFFSL